jgi:monoamine oxidase
MRMKVEAVTIIGAGLAGLSAAYGLHRAGCKVTMPAARERAGGRVSASDRDVWKARWKAGSAPRRRSLQVEGETGRVITA